MSTEEEDAIQALRRELAEASANAAAAAERLHKIVEVHIGEVAAAIDVFLVYHQYRVATERFDKLSRKFIDSWA